MKKLVAIFLAATCVFGLAACGSAKEGAAPKEETAPVTARVIEYDLTEEEYAFGVDKAQPELLEKVNAFIKEIKEDGTLETIFNNNFGDGTPVGVTSAKKDPAKADTQLVVATNAAFEPFEYMKGDQYYGVDMEVAKLLADKLGMELVIDNMDFNAVCLSVGQHKCDIAMSGLTVKEEREEHVTFSESYYQASQRLIVPSDDTEFADCVDAEAVIAKLKTLTDKSKIGVQEGTTGQLFVEGDEEWEFEKLPVTCKTYKNGSLAVQDMLNGNIVYVIIDAAPASAITEAINAMR